MIPAILTFLASLFKFLRVFNLPSKQIRKVVSIYDSMHTIVEKTSVTRLLIIKAHNSGGWIRPDTPLYITVLYEDYTRPLESMKDDYQKMLIDEDYLRMLKDLTVTKKLQIDPKMLKEGILKAKYDGEGVKFAEVYFLGQDRRNLYFCTLTSITAENFDTYSDRSVIQVGVNNIRNNIR